MKTILITGGTSGIGKALAIALAKEGKTVIVTGRDLKKLDEFNAEFPQIHTQLMDVSNYQSIDEAKQSLLSRFNDLDTIINNAGIQNIHLFSESMPANKDTINEEIDINFKGPIFVTNAFLPHLKTYGGTIVFVSSGLAFIPLAKASIYSASKAAIHSFCISLRYQLKNSKVRIIEVIPPVVKTKLHRHQAVQPSNAMELDSFIEKTVAALKTDKVEIPIGLAKVLVMVSRFLPNLFLKIINSQR